MKHAALIAALLLSACAAPAPLSIDMDILWQVRPPGKIAVVAKKHSHQGAKGLAWYRAKPCRIMTPPLTYRTLWILEHEYRHCVDWAFHE